MVARIARRVEVAAGDVITAEGDRDDRFYTFADGTARVTIGRRTMATLVPGDFFGEVSLLDPGPRTATVTASTDVVLYRIEGAAFRDLLLEAPFVAVSILRGLARRLRAVDRALRY
jgi:CRP/FNR family cyclic AMP-dependent transcriptional regulator